ncbi:TonB-dependent receptor [Fulvivirga imtechensis]|uniref:TonB-dependent receptor n=1 Tax=Fulvivirga imtechensis TaxID=881893 RepID=UPI00058D5693|nr:TonB-dependent receptor [Fulvivirga imtechensis]
MKYFNLYIVLFLGIIPLHLSAQEDWENDGEIEDVQIEIVKDREIKLPQANRNFEKIPPINTEVGRGSIEYFYNNINFDLPDLNVRMRPLRIKDEKLSKLYGNYVKAGFGNYTTPYVEGFFNSKRSKERSYGAHFNYLNSSKGPVDGKNSGSGRLDIDLFGKYFTPKVTLSGDAGFNQRSYHFYGYPENQEVNEDTLKQYFNNYYLKGSLENTDKKSDFRYTLGFQLDHLKDNRDASESEGQINLNTEYALSDEAFVRLIGDVDVITRKDNLIDDQTRNLFRIRPSFGFGYEGFRLEAGFNAVYENDTLGDSDKMHFYPIARASYPFTESMELYAGIGGDIHKNTLRTLSEENPYINDNIGIYHTNKTFDLYGGMQAKLSSKLGFGAGFSAANYKNMYFFVNAPEDQSKFEVIYDTGNTTVLNIFAQLSFNNAEQFRITARGDYWGYGTDNIDEPWHKPNYKVSSLASYNLYGKFIFTAEAYAIGGIRALDMDTGETVKLDALFDLNFKTDYLISDQVSVFLQFNNIFGKEYELFYHYPSRSLQFMAGLTYSF